MPYLQYDSRNLQYKSPFGAVPQGTEVTFTLAAEGANIEKVRLVVEIEKIEGNRERVEFLDTTKYPMESIGFSEEGRKLWRVAVKFCNIHVYRYYFEVICEDQTLLYGNNAQLIDVPYNPVIGTGGKGTVYTHIKDVVRYTQTVYDPQFTTPDWSKDVIYYYIFPERFKNGDKTNNPKPGIRKFYGDKDIELHENWLDKPWVPGDGSDEEYCNDFFGGDLAGVRQKLSYLKDLGINMIYFTPLFQAPSNHKYDTADYMKIDENFGTNEEFKELVQEAKAIGIKMMIDTSLNHSGADSIYMDRYGKYEGVGAFKGEVIREDSPYCAWYDLDQEAVDPDQAYKQWFNPTLAELKESDSYKDFAYRNEDSVTKYWLDMGIAGWRMDVAPWKSDIFWREWRREVKKKNPDALTVCETWFDSSKFLLGDTFDSTMNYIFRQAMYAYANGEKAVHIVSMLEMVRENYPPEAFYSLMNLLSTHDTQRALYYFEYKEEGESEEVVKKAKKKLLLAMFFQMTYPGCPAIYYGDEVGVTGGEDPYNRQTYPWEEEGGCPDTELLEQCKELIKLRNDHPVLRRGTIETIYQDDHVIVMVRRYEETTAIVAVNNADQIKTVCIDTIETSLAGTFVDALQKEDIIEVIGDVLQIEVGSCTGKVWINHIQ